MIAQLELRFGHFLSSFRYLHVLESFGDAWMFK